MWARMDCGNEPPSLGQQQTDKKQPLVLDYLFRIRDGVLCKVLCLCLWHGQSRI